MTNASYTGSPLAAGSFSGFEDAGIDAGIVLSTGCAAGSEDPICSSSILGPNESPNTGVILGEAGDADLDNLLDGVNTQDAAVLEFDFVPDAEAVTFTYVFGSEEYPDFVDAGYNDVFAFYVNGTNYATIDGEDGRPRSRSTRSTRRRTPTTSARTTSQIRRSISNSTASPRCSRSLRP